MRKVTCGRCYEEAKPDDRGNWQCGCYGGPYFLSRTEPRTAYHHVARDPGEGYAPPVAVCHVDLPDEPTLPVLFDDGQRHGGDWWRDPYYYDHPDVPRDVWRYLSIVERFSPLRDVARRNVQTRTTR